MNYNKFYEHIKNSVAKFKKLDKKQPIRIISHLDCDGVSAASILIKALSRENKKYSISIVQQANEKIIDELTNESHDIFFFTDLGSGYMSIINSKLKDKTVFVLDHHELEEKAADNVIHINPHMFGIDGSKEISGSGVVYLFCKELNKKNKDMAHISIIGAVGDIQENGNGFKKLNNDILQEAIDQDLIEVKKGLRFFGSYTRPLHKVLEYSTDAYIPGITGSETNAIHFLQTIGINPKKNTTWRKLTDLTEKETQKLVAAIVMKRSTEESPEDILGFNYLLKKEVEDNLKDAKGFATLLNACGRLNNASLGIGTCLGDPKIKKRAINNLTHYRKEIVNAMNWYHDNKNSSKIIKEKNFIIINTEDNILATMAGTLASMLSRSGDFKENTFILSMAQQIDNTTKVSIRIVGYKNTNNLIEIIKEIADKVGGEAGGHKDAAGAIIDTKKEKEFINAAKEILERRSMEEEIV